MFCEPHRIYFPDRNRYNHKNDGSRLPEPDGEIVYGHVFDMGERFSLSVRSTLQGFAVSFGTIRGENMFAWPCINSEHDQPANNNMFSSVGGGRTVLD